MCQAQVPPAGIDTSRGEEKKPEIPVMCDTTDPASHNPAPQLLELTSAKLVWETLLVRNIANAQAGILGAAKPDGSL